MKFYMPEKYGKEIYCPEEEIMEAPMFYRADQRFVMENGSPAQVAFAMQAPKLIEQYGEFKYCSIDTRSHMLVPGMVPCIPGWHCDDFHRPLVDEHNRTLNQPDLETIPPMYHVICVWGDVSPMEFQNQNLDLPLINTTLPGETIYGRYNKVLESILFAKGLTRNGHPLVIRPQCFHRGTVAKDSGWRMFARATFSDHRFPKNKTRVQTQVYMKDLGAGW